MWILSWNIYCELAHVRDESIQYVDYRRAEDGLWLGCHVHIRERERSLVVFSTPLRPGGLIHINPAINITSIDPTQLLIYRKTAINRSNRSKLFGGSNKVGRP